MNEIYRIYEASKEYGLWPMSEVKFLSILLGKNDNNNSTQVFTEKIDSKVVGCICVKSKAIGGIKKGSIIFIFVEKKYRDKGIGHRLLHEGISWFKSQGIYEINFGENTGSYFWPAVPDNLAQLQDFLKREGFEFSEGPVDMFADVTHFTTPTEVYKPLFENGVTIEYATEKYKDLILQFAKEDFPGWYEYYLEDLDKGRFDQVFFAHKNNEIIAISKLWTGDSNWDLLFEKNVGGGGALGVSGKWRGKGIGLAMKSWGTEKIRDKGVKYVWISWTNSIGFYEKLGFKIWRKYSNARLDFGGTGH